MSLVAVWFLGIIVAIVVVKRIEKPATPLVVAIHKKKHHYHG
jgi:hypothetical protein